MTPEDFRQWRQTHNLKRADLAALLPVSPRTIEQWEVGRRAIPAIVKRALSDVARELAQKSA